jgi:hypothetical protein
MTTQITTTEWSSGNHDGAMVQILVTIDQFNAKAVLTRYRGGNRNWTVRGSYHASGDFPVECQNGTKNTFTRSDALRMAEIFILHGREFL